MLTKTPAEYNFKVINTKDGNKRVIKEIIMPKVVKEYKYTIVVETTTRKETETVKRICHDGGNKNSSYVQSEETLPTKVITTVRSYIQDSGSKDKPPQEFIQTLPGKVSTVSYIENASKKVKEVKPPLPSNESIKIKSMTYKQHSSLDKTKPPVKYNNYTLKTKSFIKDNKKQLSKSFTLDKDKDKDKKKYISTDYKCKEVKSYAKTNVTTNVKPIVKPVVKPIVTTNIKTITSTTVKEDKRGKSVNNYIKKDEKKENKNTRGSSEIEYKTIY